MDRHFLEFWGNFLLQVAKGQKQLEDLTEWSKRGFANFGDFTPLFRQAYGLALPKQDSPDYLEIWKKAEENFRNSFQDYLSLLGVVSLEEYVKLTRKYKELGEKLAEQEELIKQLRKLLSEKGLDYAVITMEFQQLMKKQGEQFEELMTNFGEAFKEVAANADAS